MPFQDLITCFPDQPDRIRQLRADLPVFDEICRDYVALLAEQRDLNASGEARERDWQACIAESLAALRDEIAATLKSQAEFQAAQETEPQETTQQDGDQHAV